MPQITLNTLREQRANALDRRKALHEAALAESRDFSKEEKDEFDKLGDEADTLRNRIAVGEKVEAEQGELGAIPPPQPVTSRQELSTLIKDQLPQKAESFDAQMRTGGKLRAFQNKADAYGAGMWLLARFCGNESAYKWCKQNRNFSLTEGTPSAGGYLVPEPLANAIIDLREQYGVLRREAQIYPMMSDTAKVPVRNTGITTYWVAEASEITASDPSWGQVNLTAKKLGALTKISSEVQEDAVINIADWVAQEFAYGFAYTEDLCGFNGDGTPTYGSITGIVTRLDGTTLAGSAVCPTAGHDTFSEIDSADIGNVMGKLPLYARAGAKWYCSSVFADMVFGRLMVAGGGNNIQTLSGGYGLQYMGYPIVPVQVMRAGSTTDYSDVAMCLLGNLRLGVLLGDRRGINVKTLNERYAEYDLIGLVATERLDVNAHGYGTSSVAGPIVALVGGAS